MAEDISWGDEGAAFYAIFFCVILVLICCWGGALSGCGLGQYSDKWPATMIVFIITFVVWCGLFFGYNLDEIERSLDYYPAAPDGTCLVLNQTLTSSVCCKTSNDKCTPNANCRSALFKDCSTLQTLYQQDDGQLYLPQSMNSTLVVESKCCAYENNDDTSTSESDVCCHKSCRLSASSSGSRSLLQDPAQQGCTPTCDQWGLNKKDFRCDTCSVGKLELLYYTSDEASDKNSPDTTCNNVSGCYIKSYQEELGYDTAKISSWSSEYGIGATPKCWYKPGDKSDVVLSGDHAYTGWKWFLTAWPMAMIFFYCFAVCCFGFSSVSPVDDDNFSSMEKPNTFGALMATCCCFGVLLPWVFWLPLSTSKEFHWEDKQGFFMAATSMFSFIGMPAFVIALKMANMLHPIAAVVLWVSWAVPIGVVLPIWYSENHINSMSAAWMVPIILIPLLGTAIAVAIHIVFKKRGGGVYVPIK